MEWWSLLLDLRHNRWWGAMASGMGWGGGGGGGICGRLELVDVVGEVAADEDGGGVGGQEAAAEEEGEGRPVRCQQHQVDPALSPRGEGVEVRGSGVLDESGVKPG